MHLLKVLMYAVVKYVPRSSYRHGQGGKVEKIYDKLIWFFFFFDLDKLRLSSIYSI